MSVNRLAQETSPYLLQHADNPVDWYPWGEEAFAKARAEDKPILLSVGYAACHWCHVMEHESFEDDETAALMNERFVNIKVDREERPDVDSLYMDAVVALTGHGGWPMTVFLTPEGEPFLGGTYYPPEPRHGLPSFRQVLVAVSDAYRDRRGDVAHPGGRARRGGAAARCSPSADPLTESLLGQALAQPPRRSSTRSGEAGAARPSSRSRRCSSSSCACTCAGTRTPCRWCTATLDAMAAGGMYDLLGGGFHRYSVDRQWLVPHFEKMLYDNALLAATYLHAWVVTGEERYRRVAEETLDYLLRELRLPGGRARLGPGRGHRRRRGADLHLDAGGGRARGAPAAVRARAVRSSAASSTTRSADGSSSSASSGRSRLATTRRSRPGTGSRWRRSPRRARRLERDDYLDAARELGEFLLGPLSTEDGRLHRTFRAGQAKGTGYLEDYADVANGLLELHVATGELRWLEEANRLARLAVELFARRGARRLLPLARRRRELVARKKDLEDQPTPSGNSMLALVLLKLARIYGDEELERQAVGVFRLVHGAMARVPLAFGHALTALDLHFSTPRELAIVGPVDSPVARAALEPFQPEHGRRRRAVGGGPAPRRQGARRRQARGLRLRALRLPGAGDRT